MVGGIFLGVRVLVTDGHLFYLLRMSELIKLEDQHDALVGAAIGGGVGAAGGVLVELLRAKPSLRSGLVSAFLGGGLGAGVGAGVGSMGAPLIDAKKDLVAPKVSSPQAVAAEPTVNKPRMGETTAALSGLLVGGVGPAIHAGYVGGAGQAARSGGRSLLEGLAAQQLAGLLSKGHTTTQVLAGMLGSAHGAYAAAQNFNERNAS